MEYGQALDPTLGEIRLICLLPNIDTEGDIRCELVRRSLHEEMSYSALSYVWGNRESPQAISLSGTSVPVTPNLFAALRRLRHATETMYLWVDALCINQDDYQERSSQVEQMGKIYEKAEAVLMWLGEEEDNSNLAMGLVDLLRTTVREGDRVVSQWKSKENTLDVLGNISFEQHWLALGHLFQRPYWSRVWIVQEVMFAKRAILCCGASKCEWLGLRELLYAASDSDNSPNHLSSAAIDVLLHPVSFPKSLATMYVRQAIGFSLSFLDGLVYYRSRQATDPRDHVYAILNLVEHNGFKPDYSKSLFTLYREVAKFMIETYENLDIFSACRASNCKIFSAHASLVSVIELFDKGLEEAFECRKAQSSEETGEHSDMSAECPSNPPFCLRDSHLILKKGHPLDLSENKNARKSILEFSLPSWIPDWRQTVIESGYLFLTNSDKRYYKAGGRTKPKVHFPEEEHIIMVGGVRIDSIKDVSSETTNSAIKENWDLWRLGGHPTHLYGDHKQQEDAFLQTMVTGRNLDGSKGNRHLSAHAVNYLYELGFTDEGQQEEDEYPDVREWMSIGAMEAWFMFCITNQGFMGRVPLGTQPGDIIAVFLGARVPFVLRKDPDKDRYCLVGECYVHGIMEGEVINELERKERELEEFYLI